MDRSDRIYVAGHRGLVGSALLRRLHADGYENLLVADRSALDLRDSRAVDAFFAEQRPHYVLLAAARVGGILANDTHGGDFLRDNLLVQTHVIDAARRFGVRKLLFLGSSCIYPRSAPQPMREDALLTGPLEPTNAPYAVAKIAGIEMCRAYRRQFGLRSICLMPTNLYGPGDNFDLETSHVLPALIRRFEHARLERASRVTLWGTGTPRRELLHVDDLAHAAVLLMKGYDDEAIINVGSGRELNIHELAELVAGLVGFMGEVQFDPSRPDGIPRKALDCSRLSALGWRPRISLEEGIKGTVEWYRATSARLPAIGNSH